MAVGMRALTFIALAFLLGAALAYAGGALALNRSARGRRLLPAWRVASFTLGLTALAAALLPPLERLAHLSFAAHMLQHMLLMAGAAPLLVLGRPLTVLAHALTPAARQPFRRAVRALKAGPLLHPATVWTFFVATFVLWHLPALYNGALENPLLETAEIGSFLLSSLLFWSLVLARHGRRLRPGPALVFLVTAALLTDLPGALMALSPRPFYPALADPSSFCGLGPQADQQAAGLIMWIPGFLVYLAAALFLLHRLLLEPESHGSRRLLRHASRLAPMLLLLLLAGCTENNPAAKVAGDPEHGRLLFSERGCATCHEMAAAAGVQGRVGPPLTGVAERVYIAGVLANTPANMARWIAHPQHIVPGSAMPDLGLSEVEARDLTAFLYAHRR